MRGNVWKFGDNVDTDVILPGQYLSLEDPQQIASHCLEGVDPSFAQKVKPGDIIVAGANFGCGSSREPATQAIKDCKVGVIVAHSFARIFLRNAIAIGLPVIECPQASEQVSEGDQLEVDFTTSTLTNLATGHKISCRRFPDFMQEIIQAGGLVEYARCKLRRI